jgi:alpha-beta hydrolase superfamily lysophospholipase
VKNTLCLYLHGFASSPQSRKAKFFANQFESLHEPNLTFIAPDLNLPCFEKLSLEAGLEQARKLINSSRAENLLLYGSSLGGLMAAALAGEPAIKTRLQQLILLAPAFGITNCWEQIIGPQELLAWQKNGSRSFFHFARNKELPLHWPFLEELKNLDRHQTGLKVEVPTLIFHGTRDDTVPFAHSLSFCRANTAYAQLISLEDGHELSFSLNKIWETLDRKIGP